MNSLSISAAILVKDSQKHLKEVLSALKDFNEVLILDTGSTDESLSIARTYPNTNIHKTPFTSFGKLRNQAANLCKNNWILCIDSDEVLSPQAKEEIKGLSLEQCNFYYSFPFKNYFNKRWIKSCGWHPDRHIRLYPKNKASFSEEKVHEKLLSKHCKEQSLKGYIIHYSYSSINDFLRKMQSYSSLFAEQNTGKKRASIFTAIFHGVFAFIKSYFLKRGFLEGYEGFLISSYQAMTAFFKYLKLREANLNLLSKD
jgi:glycosyltransferase involved in cell wall biosynthesis